MSSRRENLQRAPHQDFRFRLRSIARERLANRAIGLGYPVSQPLQGLERSLGTDGNRAGRRFDELLDFFPQLEREALGGLAANPAHRGELRVFLLAQHPRLPLFPARRPYDLRELASEPGARLMPL